MRAFFKHRNITSIQNNNMNILITPKKITSHKKLKSIIHKEEEYIKLREQMIHFLARIL